MHPAFIGTFLISILFYGISFSYSQNEKPKIVLLDTCPPPRVIQIPTPLSFGEGSGVRSYGSYIIKTKSGDKTINLLPPKINPALPPAANFTNFNTEQGLALSSVRCAYKDKTGNLWFGTAGGGASKYDGKSFTTFSTAQGLANNIVWSITEDKTGNLWFGTNGGGVSRYDGKSFTTFSTAQGLANNSVWSITEDKTGNLWFGTAEGLSVLSVKDVEKLSEKKNKVKSENITLFRNYTTKNGLANDFVTQVKEDKQGNIIIGTNEGFTVLKDGLNSFKSGAIEIYNNKTGYPVKDVNAGQAMLIDSKGIIWAGTGDDKTALVRFDYSAVNKNTKPLTLFIQSVKVNEENICWYNMVQITNGNESAKEQNDTNNSHDSQFRKSAKDSLSVPDSSALLLAQFNAFGKTVPQEILDEQFKKFSDIKFDGITKWYPLPENLILPYNHNSISFDFIAIETGRNFLVRYQYILEGYDNDWSPLTEKTSATFGNIHEGTYTFKLKARSPEGVWSDPITYTFKVLPPWYRTIYMYALYILLLIGSVVLIVWWNGIRLRARAKELAEEVRKATLEISNQKNIIEEKNKNITDSINYAQRIQRAMLPHRKDIWAAFPNSFVLFKPKDIVSGDFYFFSHPSPERVLPDQPPPLGKERELNSSLMGRLGGAPYFIAVADCTGHGVPGAFMSMVGAERLTDAVQQSNDVGEILSLLNKGIKISLKQSENESTTRDGMDIALCSVEFPSRDGSVRLQYAAANRSIWIIRNGSASLTTGSQPVVEEIKATKKAIGGFTEDSQQFETHEIKLQQGDTIYLSTDGYADQFSGQTNKKLMTKKFKEILVSIQSKTMKEQGKYLDDFMENWKSGTEQIDDILVIGIRV